MMRLFAEVPDQQAVNAKPVFGDQPVFRVEVPAEHALELLFAYLRAVIAQQLVALLRRARQARRRLDVARGEVAQEKLRGAVGAAGSAGVDGRGLVTLRERRRRGEKGEKQGQTPFSARLTQQLG